MTSELLPVQVLSHAAYSAAAFDRNTFAADSSPALLRAPAPGWLDAAPLPALLTDLLASDTPPQSQCQPPATATGAAAPDAPAHASWRCPGPLRTALATALGPAVWGPGDLAALPPRPHPSPAAAPDGEPGEWRRLGLQEPRVSVFRLPGGGGASASASGDDDEKGMQEGPEGTEAHLLRTMSTPPFASLLYCVLLRGGPVEWTAGAGCRDEHEFRKLLRTAQQIGTLARHPGGSSGSSSSSSGAGTGSSSTTLGADELRRIGCRAATFEQRAGEVVVVPPRCLAQALVRTTRSTRSSSKGSGSSRASPVVMVSWLAHNPATLEIATNELTGAWRREARALPADFFRLVVAALEWRVRALEAGTLAGLSSPPSADLGVLLRCVSKRLANETVAMDDVERLALARAPDVLHTPRTDDAPLHCSHCRTRIAGRYYYCPRCDEALRGPTDATTNNNTSTTSDNSVTAATTTTTTTMTTGTGTGTTTTTTPRGCVGPVFCLECVVEGQRCDHVREYELCEVVPQAQLRALQTRTVALLDQLQGAGMGEMVVRSVGTGRYSDGTVAHTLVCMAAEDHRATCHQCKLAKARYKVVLCTNSQSLSSKAKPRACCKKYCFSCLWNRYSIRQGDCLRQRNWCCPFCENRCNCSACLRKKRSAAAAAATTTTTGSPGGTLPDQPLAPLLFPPRASPPPPLPLTLSALSAASQQQQRPGTERDERSTDDGAESTGDDDTEMADGSSSSSTFRPQKYARVLETGGTRPRSVPTTPPPANAPTGAPRFLARLGPYSQEFLARPLTTDEHAAVVWADAPPDTVPLFFFHDRMVVFVRRGDMRPCDPAWLPFP